MSEWAWNRKKTMVCPKCDYTSKVFIQQIGMDFRHFNASKKCPVHRLDLVSVYKKEGSHEKKKRSQ